MRELLKKRLKYSSHKNEEAVGCLKKRLDVLEWDFTQVSRQEEQACCYYEYARESIWLMDRMDNPPPVHRLEFDRFTNKYLNPLPKEESLLRDNIENSLLTYAFPGCGRIDGGYLVGRQKNFDGRPWLGQEPEWRQEFCQNMEKYKDRLGYARILNKTSDRAFAVGIAPPFPWQRWEDEHEKRIFDKDTGLEAILVTVDWENFKDNEIIKQFGKWLKSKDGRPEGVGLKTRQGKRGDAWRKKLERLALMRLRHHYSLDEMAFLLPTRWRSLEKFADNSEVERERNAAQQTLFELFPFLPKDTIPINWSKV